MLRQPRQVAAFGIERRSKHLYVGLGEAYGRVLAQVCSNK
jgi:hypothetical protein